MSDSIAQRVHQDAIRTLRHRMVTDFDNTLSDSHDRALSLMLEGMVSQAFQIETGRLAYPLPCGAGKTQGVVALVRALHGVGEEVGQPFCGRSLLVAQNQIEALITLYNDLIKAGVPAAAVGLVYSGEPRSVLPTTENDRRPVLLVSHERVRGTGDAGKWDAVTQYRPRFASSRPKSRQEDLMTPTLPLLGQVSLTRTREGPRDLLIWDEVLLSTHAFSITTEAAAGVTGWVTSSAKESSRPYRRECAAYIAECWSLIDAERNRQVAGERPRAVILPTIPEGLQQAYLDAFKHLSKGDTSVFRTLVEMHGMAARFTFVKDPQAENNTAGMVSFEVAVPDAHENIAILDAGHAVNRLVALDKRIGYAVGFGEKGVITGKDTFAPVKTFETLTIHTAYGSSGRESTEKDWASDQDRQAPREVVDAIKSIPENEHILIWTFKPDSWRKDLPKLIKDRLLRAGVDPNAKLPDPKHPDDRTKDRPRITIETFGRHVGHNNWAHVENVLFAGVLQRDRFDLLASSMAQVRNILTDGRDLIPVSEVSRGEVAGVLVQAINRGRCRYTDNGTARPMKVWLRHNDRHIREELNKLLPGAQWVKWYGSEGRGDKIDSIATKIKEALLSLPADVVSISARKLKQTAGLENVPNQTFIKARDQLDLASMGWSLDGRSFVRSAQHHGFRDEAALDAAETLSEAA